MTSSSNSIETTGRSPEAFQQYVRRSVEDALGSLPETRELSGYQRRGILARYTAVLEGNFIYWMTGAYLAVKSEEARSIILVADCHPGMMRRFAIAANAAPTDSDALAVSKELTGVRLFIGKLRGVPIVLMMAFFEGFIQRFMPFLADLAEQQGSEEREYTDVHGVCDIAHTEGLFRALTVEMDANPLDAQLDPFEGVELLCRLIKSIIYAPAGKSVIESQLDARATGGARVN